MFLHQSPDRIGRTIIGLRALDPVCACQGPVENVEVCQVSGVSYYVPISSVTSRPGAPKGCENSRPPSSPISTRDHEKTAPGHKSEEQTSSFDDREVRNALLMKCAGGDNPSDPTAQYQHAPFPSRPLMGLSIYR